jgi:hypothetical protein
MKIKNGESFELELENPTEGYEGKHCYCSITGRTCNKDSCPKLRGEEE